jgi:hypothetical protein
LKYVEGSENWIRKGETRKIFGLEKMEQGEPEPGYEWGLIIEKTFCH